MFPSIRKHLGIDAVINKLRKMTKSNKSSLFSSKDDKTSQRRKPKRDEHSRATGQTKPDFLLFVEDWDIRTSQPNSDTASSPHESDGEDLDTLRVEEKKMPPRDTGLPAGRPIRRLPAGRPIPRLPARRPIPRGTQLVELPDPLVPRCIKATHYRERKSQSTIIKRAPRKFQHPATESQRIEQRTTPSRPAPWPTGSSIPKGFQLIELGDPLPLRRMKATHDLSKRSHFTERASVSYQR